MCFSPQRRTIFQHLNFQKWSRIVSFLTFSLPNVLFATAAYNFSTSELPKVVPDPQFFDMFTSECAFRHSGVQFLMSPLSTYLRTRRFNRPTFGLTWHTNLWKNTALRDFSNIWRACIFFSSNFLTIASSVDWLDYSMTWLLYYCFSTLHIVGSFYLNFLRSWRTQGYIACSVRYILFQKLKGPPRPTIKAKKKGRFAVQQKSKSCSFNQRDRVAKGQCVLGTAGCLL